MKNHSCRRHVCSYGERERERERRKKGKRKNAYLAKDAAGNDMGTNPT
jgi:hypothetical protein